MDDTKKTMLMKNIIRMQILLVLLLVFLPSALSVALGVNPAAMEFKNVLKGGYAQGTIYVSTDSPENITITIERLGDTASWLEFDDNVTSFYINNANPHYLKVKVLPPTDIISTNYSGSIRLVSSGLASANGTMSNAVLAAFLISIKIGITGDQVISCNAGSIVIDDSEINFPSTVKTLINNEGNVRINPTMTIDVWDKYQQKIVRTQEASLNTVLPTETESFVNELLLDLNEGQYWANIKIPLCKAESITTFSVVEKGGVIDKGEFLRIDAPVWAKANEILPVTGYFKNTGSRVVSAKFKGEVKEVGGRVVKVIDTDTLDIYPGEVGELKSFFKPSKEGQYIITGRVTYNNKVSYEKDFMININGVAANDAKNTPWLIFIVLTIIILILLILIKHKKTKIKKHHPK